MFKATQPARTHRRRELAPARPPILIGLIVATLAVLVFAMLSRVLN